MVDVEILNWSAEGVIFQEIMFLLASFNATSTIRGLQFSISYNYKTINEQHPFNIDNKNKQRLPPIVNIIP